MFLFIFDRTFPKIKPIAVFIATLGFASSARAGDYFNPAFLDNDPAVIADLSRFEKGENQAPGSYHVDIYLNGQFVKTENVNFIDSKYNTAPEDDTGLVPSFTREQLESIGVNISALTGYENVKPDDKVDFLSAIKGSVSDFDFDKQRLNLSIPQIFLKNVARGYIPPEHWDQGINALLLSYNFTGSDSDDRSASGQNSQSYFLGLNGGVNVGAWRLRDYSTWNYNNTEDSTDSKWQHINTFAERTIVPLKGELLVGEQFTPSDIFESVAFRGIQLVSDDNMLPDSLRGFAPTIRGIAQSNAQVTVRQNNYVIYQTYVPPGAFVINDLYPTSSSGDLQIEVKEVDGSVNRYTIPYSSVPVLQRDGRLKYAATLANYRAQSGDQNDDGFFQGSLIYGLPKGITLYGGSQLSSHYHAESIGIGANMGLLGAISTDITQANSELADESKHQGQSIRFLYSKSLINTGTDFQLIGYRYSTSGYYTFEDTTYKHMSGDIDNSSDEDEDEDYQPQLWMDYYDLRYNKRGKIQAVVSQQLTANTSLSLSASQQSYWNTDDKDTYAQVSFNGTVHDINLGLSYSYSKSLDQDDTDHIFSLSVSLPLSLWLSGGRNDITRQQHSMYATYNLSTDNHGHTTNNAGLNGTALEDDNLSYSIQEGFVNQGEGNSGNLNLNYQGTYGNAGMGYNYSDNGNFQQINYNFTGGMIAHSHGVTFGQPLGETNVLIAAPGADNVKVENSTGVHTDWRGYTIVPYATVYRENRTALDTRSLGNNVDIDSAVTTVVPTKGAVVRADFNTHVGLRALMMLTYNKQMVPFGAMVTDDTGRNSGIVGDDGQVYLSGMGDKGQLHVQWGNGANNRCDVRYQFNLQQLKSPVIRSSNICQ